MKSGHAGCQNRQRMHIPAVLHPHHHLILTAFEILASVLGMVLVQCGLNLHLLQRHLGGSVD